jgi:nitrogen fixation protein FixH
MTRILFLLPLAAALMAQPAPDWKITVQPPAVLKSDADMAMQVKVTDAKGAPVAGAKVEWVLTMIDMDHGEFKTVAKETKPGIYAGKSQFMMGGGWNMEVRVVKGAQKKVEKIKLQVKD